MPKVTVLMAVYNGERYLREAIESILAQTFQDFEFLIINDGSTDGTRHVISSYHDPRICLIDNSHNLGLTQSLNQGLELATGQFIARQDADDLSEPERLAKQVAFMEMHPEVALLGTWYKEIDSDGAVTGYGKPPCNFTQIRWCLLFFCPFAHSAVMLRKSIVLEQIGLYNEDIPDSEDFELWSRIARHLTVINLNEYLLKLRISPWSMTATYGDRVYEQRRIAVANVSRLLGWDKTKPAVNEAHFNLLFSLIFGTLPSLSPNEVRWTIAESLRLQYIFCQDYGISQTESQVHHTELSSRISRRLVRMAQRFINKRNYADAWQILTLAGRLYWPILLSRKYDWSSSQFYSGELIHSGQDK